MRILLVVHQFFPFFYTGTERVTLNLAKQYQRMGHTPRVLTYGFGDTPDAFEPFTEGMRRRDFAYDGVPVTSLLHEVRPALANFTIEDAQAGAAVRRFLELEPFDVVHVTHPMTLPPVAHVAKSLSIPVVMTLTDFWLVCPRTNLLTAEGTRCLGASDSEACVRQGCFDGSWGDLLRERADHASQLLDACDAIVSPSTFVRSIFKASGFSRPVHTIRHGVDTSVVGTRAVRESRADLVFGFIGTISPIKGVHTLIEAWSGLQCESSQLRVYGEAFGRDDYLSHVERAAAEDRRVSFLGRYEYEDLGRILRELDVVVVPSIVFESSSLVVSSALSAGVPVIAPNVGGPPELVRNGESGFTFSPGDAIDLRRAMERFCRQPSLVDDLRKSMVEPPRIEDEALQYEQLYASL